MISLIVVLFATSVGVATESWPELRGPHSDGQADAQVPLVWSETKNVTWKTAIHGRAWSTPVVLGPQIWLTTATEDGKEMAVLCVDRQSGKVLHDRVIFQNEKPRPLGNPVNCYASPSPAIAFGRVYVSFGSYGTACVDTRTFKTIWERRDLPCNHYCGPASSLVLLEDLVIFHMDGIDQQYVVALDARTGKTRWRTERSTDYGDVEPDGKPIRGGVFRKAYNTPLIVRTGGEGQAGTRVQLLSPGAKAAFSYDPRTGKELWTVRYDTHSTASRTLFLDGVAFINTGFPKAQLWAVRTDGHGDVTDTHVVWKGLRSVPRRSSPVLVDGLIFMCSDQGITSCVEARTGEFVWQERIGGTYSASAVHVAGRIYLFSEEGRTTVIEPGRELKILATNTLDDGFMASPAVAGREFYLRTKTHLYRIEKQP